MFSSMSAECQDSIDNKPKWSQVRHRYTGQTQEVKDHTIYNSHLRHNRLGHRSAWPSTRLSPLWYLLCRQFCCSTKRHKSTRNAHAQQYTIPPPTTPRGEPSYCAPKYCPGEETRNHVLLFVRVSAIAVDTDT